MSRKLHIAFPACCVLVAALLIAYFCVVGTSVKSGSSAAAAEETVSVQEISAKSVGASSASFEAVVSQANDAEEASQSFESDDIDSDEAAAGSGYELTDSERIAVECAVMCEAGGEGVDGQMMVAQSILDGSLRNGYDVFETIYAYQIHSTSYSNVTDEVRESVSRVFDDGERITEEKTDLWYNPALVESEWHEDQQYVITIGSHRFFWMNDDM